MRRNKGLFFRKQFSKFIALDNSDLKIKRSLPNKTTDYNNYTYKNYSFKANLLIRDRDKSAKLSGCCCCDA